MLSNRQIEVLALIAQGLTYVEIGKALHIAPTTAKTHAANILRALGARNAAHAVAIGFRDGLLDVDAPKATVTFESGHWSGNLHPSFHVSGIRNTA